MLSVSLLFFDEYTLGHPVFHNLILVYSLFIYTVGYRLAFSSFSLLFLVWHALGHPVFDNLILFYSLFIYQNPKHIIHTNDHSATSCLRYITGTELLVFHFVCVPKEASLMPLSDPSSIPR